MQATVFQLKEKRFKNALFNFNANYIYSPHVIFKIKITK